MEKHLREWADKWKDTLHIIEVSGQSRRLKNGKREESYRVLEDENAEDCYTQSVRLLLDIG